VVGTSSVSQPEIGFFHVLDHKVWMLARVQEIQKVTHQALTEEYSEIERWRMIPEAFKVPTSNN
jgi:hypothetical protein